MVFPWSLSDIKSPHVSRTLLSIMGNLSNTVIWIVSTYPLISKSSSPFTNRLGIVPSALITISVTLTFVLHNFFSSLVSSKYLLMFSFIIIIIIIIIHFFFEFFTPALADRFSLESERQQISSRLQNSSLYSGRPQ